LIFQGFVYKFTISKFTNINLQKETKMYADKKKSQKVYVESKCVSRDDCCWDETPDTLEVVTVNENTTQDWPTHWTRQL
jgi:hypothetical protein